MTAIRVCIGLAGHTGGNFGINPLTGMRGCSTPLIMKDFAVTFMLTAQEKNQKFPLEWANVISRRGYPGRNRELSPIPPLQADQEPCPMTFKIRYPLAIAVLFASQALVPAQGALNEQSFNYDTAKDLIEVCSSEAESAAFGCRAFLEATVQYHDAVSDRKKMKPLICPPKGTTIAQAREAFLAWGQKHADRADYMKEIPVVAVVRALGAAYPCK